MVICALVLLTAGADVSPDHHSAQIRGDWELVSARTSGKEFRTDKNLVRVNAVHWVSGGSAFEYVLYCDRTPCEIDWILGGKVWKGIYELTPGLLHLCVAKPGQPRPRQFETLPGDGRMMHVRRRVKIEPRLLPE